MPSVSVDQLVRCSSMSQTIPLRCHSWSFRTVTIHLVLGQQCSVQNSSQVCFQIRRSQKLSSQLVESQSGWQAGRKGWFVVVLYCSCSSPQTTQCQCQTLFIYQISNLKDKVAKRTSWFLLIVVVAEKASAPTEKTICGRLLSGLCVTKHCSDNG